MAVTVLQRKASKSHQLKDTPKTTVQHLTARSGKSVAYVTNSKKKLCSRFVLLLTDTKHRAASLRQQSFLFFLVSHFSSLLIPCGRLSWLPVSFLLHVKYTLLYRIVSYLCALQRHLAYTCHVYPDWLICITFHSNNFDLGPV